MMNICDVQQACVLLWTLEQLLNMLVGTLSGTFDILSYNSVTASQACVADGVVHGLTVCHSGGNKALLTINMFYITGWVGGREWDWPSAQPSDNIQHEECEVKTWASDHCCRGKQMHLFSIIRCSYHVQWSTKLLKLWAEVPHCICCILWHHRRDLCCVLWRHNAQQRPCLWCHSTQQLQGQTSAHSSSLQTDHK